MLFKVCVYVIVYLGVCMCVGVCLLCCVYVCALVLGGIKNFHHNYCVKFNMIITVL